MKKSNTIDVAVIKNDLTWIKDKLNEIDTKVENIHGCTGELDNRVLRLEDWQRFSKENFNKTMAKWALIASVVAILISTAIHFMG